MAESLESEAEAQEYTQQFKWREAAEIYEHVASRQAETPTLAAETWHRVGECYSLASRQTSDQESFRRLREKAVTAYTTAAFLF